MNIFVLNKNPTLIAKHYCDIHLRKMLVEHVQLLCNAMPEAAAPYKRTHYNHPCSKWARASAQNWAWLSWLTQRMGIEYYARFNKYHKSSLVLGVLLRTFDPLVHLPDTGGVTPWPQVMPDEFKVEQDPVAAYRRYYAAKLRSFRARGLM